MKKLTFLLLLLSNIAFADVTLPAIFSDNMVLQRNAEVALWGWANPNEEVTVTTSWNQKEYKFKTNNQANWQVKVSTPPAGGPYTITIKGYKEIVLKNILIGEVWLCSGQSNMEMSAAWGIDNGDEEVQLAQYPNIRFFKVPKLTATTPQNDLKGAWKLCTPETMKEFSAVAYYFGKRLQEDLKEVPIGLISSNWGGTPAEIWIPETAINDDKIVFDAAQKLTPAEWGPIEPARAYNAMIAPLVGFKIAGTLWYQGESNVGSKVYDRTLSTLITSWRKAWNTDFPFYYVQIAPFNYDNNTSSGAIIRNAQRKVLQQVKKTGMVVTSDAATTDDIHPKDKKTVGTRLANLALANTYKTTTATVNGPLFKKIEVQKNTVIVHFDYAEGLRFKNKPSTQFEVAGADGVYHTAKASIKNNTVMLTSSKVKNPVKVRYAWKNTDLADLVNAANLPASTFGSEL